MRLMVWFTLLAAVPAMCQVDSPRRQIEEMAAGMVCLAGIPDGLISLAWLSSDDFFHRGDYERAYSVLRLITRLEPSDPEAWSSAAWLLINGIAPRHTGRRREELTAAGSVLLQEGIALTPGRWELLFDMGWELLRQGEAERALSYLDTAVKLDPPLKVYRLRAEALMKTGRYRDAVDAFRQMREAFPQYRGVADRFIRQLTDGSGTDTRTDGATP